jgi:hypothetical protein
MGDPRSQRARNPSLNTNRVDDTLLVAPPMGDSIVSPAPGRRA